MNTENGSEEKGKTQYGKRIVTTLLIIFILIGLAMAARYLVGNFDIVEFLKKLHGG